MAPVDIPASAISVFTDTACHVEHIDVLALDDLAELKGLRVVIATMPGTRVDPARPLFHINGMVDDETIAQMRKCVSVGDDVNMSRIRASA